MYIDTHVHLNNDALYQELDYYIEKAQKENVQNMIVIGYDPLMNQRAIEIAEKYEFIYASVGIHPTRVKDMQSDEFEQLKAWVKHPKVVAVGECGMDLYWDKSNEEAQIDIFKKQIKLAQALDMPLSIHMREATQVTYDTLKLFAPVKGIMHCYSGSKEMAKKFIELGLHISLGGPVTFKNAKTPKAVAKIVPKDKLLIETDAPFLAPHPFRGKQNDSSYLPLIAKSIAKERDVSIEDIADITSKNAQKLFKLE